MTPKLRLNKTLAGEEVDRPPAVIPTQNATIGAMESCGVFWPEALREPEAMATLAIASQETCGLEAVRVPFDICVEADSLGCATRFGDKVDPPVSEPKARDSLGDLEFQDEGVVDGRMASVVKAVEIASIKKDDDIPLIAALGTPFEVLCTAYGFEDLFEDLYSQPDMLKEVLDKMLTMLVNYGKLLQKAGADFIMVVDGTSQNLMPAQFQEFSAPYTEKLINVFDIPSILHVCGPCHRLLDDMVKTGPNAISIDSPVPIDLAKKAVQGKCAIVGAINVIELYEGNPEDVRGMVKDCEQKGYDIIAPGCGVVPSTSLNNMLALSNTIKSINR